MEQITYIASLILVDKVPQLLICLHIKWALIISDALYSGEPETVTCGKVSAENGSHICLHLQRSRKQLFSKVVLNSASTHTQFNCMKFCFSGQKVC